jgi:NADH:ubiquinone oxidoreductase subunit 3 (subunit A)
MKKYKLVLDIRVIYIIPLMMSFVVLGKVALLILLFFIRIEESK